MSDHSQQWTGLVPPTGAVFTVAAASEILGVPRRKIVLFVEQKIFTPSAPAEGRGRSRRFSFLDLLKILLASHLSGLGLAPRRVATCVNLVNWARLLAGDTGYDGKNVDPAMWGSFDPVKMASVLPEVAFISLDVEGKLSLHTFESDEEVDTVSLPPASMAIRYKRILEELAEGLDAYWKAGGAIG
jgi:hypothetical protein